MYLSSKIRVSWVYVFRTHLVKSCWSSFAKLWFCFCSNLNILAVKVAHELILAAACTHLSHMTLCACQLSSFTTSLLAVLLNLQDCRLVSTYTTLLYVPYIYSVHVREFDIHVGTVVGAKADLRTYVSLFLYIKVMGYCGGRGFLINFNRQYLLHHCTSRAENNAVWSQWYWQALPVQRDPQLGCELTCTEAAAM